MKRISAVIALSLLMSSSYFYGTAQVNEKQINIIPLPQRYTQGVDSFEIDTKTVLYTQNKNQRIAVEALQSCIPLIKKSEHPKKRRKNTIEFKENTSLPQEAYSLQITKDNILIEASDSTGYLYAVQSLKQLLRCDSIAEKGANIYKLPVLQIEDAPRFEYRGVMLDVSRCFIPKEHTIKKWWSF